MLWVMIQKELRAVLLSPKFAATFAVCSILILAGVLSGILEYKASEAEYHSGKQLNSDFLSDRTNWSVASNKAYRQSSPLQIFVSGVAHDVGRWSYVKNSGRPRLIHSEYSDNPLFAVFRFLDLSFIVIVVLSLFAIVYTYDAVCGERESGTLRLVFSHSVSRARYLVAKCVGTWLGLLVPLMVPILVSVLLLPMFSVVMTGEDWLRLALILSVSILVLTFFVVFGIFVSTLARHPSHAFVLSLMGWLLLVFVIPRLAVCAATDVVAVTSLEEIEGQQGSYVRDRRKQYVSEFGDAFKRYVGAHGNGMITAELQLAFQDSMQAAMHQAITDHEAKLMADRQRSEAEIRRLAFSLSRLSPTATYQLVGMTLANTDVGLNQRYEEAVNRYRSDVTDFCNRLGIDAPGVMRSQASSISGGPSSVWYPEARGERPANFPLFLSPEVTLRDVAGQIAVDIGLLVGFVLLAFAAAWVSFMRYDLR